ncbi:MAG: hypothetical protein JXX29_00635 [Deltaproteobacteria bacterium]|nr:hypothetical protein [Deltaproteobacteria bacterium]
MTITNNKRYFEETTFWPVAILAWVAVFVCVPGCDNNEDDHEEGECGGHGHLHDGVCHCDEGYTTDPADATVCVATDAQTFDCTLERDGWEQCLDNKVQYCHIVEGMDPHFHWGADCEALGYACVQLTESEAVCVDDSSTCTAGEFKCEANTAYNCIDEDGHSHWAIEPCGTAAHCHEEAAEAHCEEEESVDECDGHGHLDGEECHCEDGYGHDGDDTSTCVIQPAGMCTLFGGEPHSHEVVTTFADFPNAHADLYEPIEVELPAGAASYIHFPCMHDGEYVIFVDNATVIDAVMHRDETDVASFYGAGANGVCATEIPEHYHVELAMDADEAPVPYIIRFTDQLTEATTVRFMVVDE